jgi:putative membrane protein
MSTLPSEQKVKNFKRFTIIASIAIPLVVAILTNPALKIKGVDTSFLPPIYATLNGLTAIMLILALIAVKKKNIKLHELLIKLCIVFSLLFLVCYVVYHLTSLHTEYLGDFNSLYYFILSSHIILSIAVVPLVLFTYLFAWQGNFEKHKKWTKITWPLWFYVAVTGVIVYWMISPFYK